MKWFAKMIFDGGGGKSLKNQLKSKCYPSNIFKNLKSFTNHIATFLTPRREEELSRGVVLIEFAVCMPVLIILLFYINDLVRIKRYYSQTEFVGQQIANMLQNISQKRASSATTDIERKKLLRINLNDVYRINRIACLSIYPGLTQQTSPFPLGHWPYVLIYYVKNNKDGTASLMWRSAFYGNTGQTLCVAGGDAWSSIRWKTKVTPSEIYQNLKFGSEDAKIIVEVCLRKNLSDEKQSFGLHFIKPKRSSYDGNQYPYFHNITIFTPKPGLFYESVIKSSYADSDF